MPLLDPVSPASSGTNPDRALVVDLDGTLIYSDLLWEGVLLFLKKHFWRVWILPFWLLGGKAEFKRKIAAAVDLNPALLPYDAALIDEIARQRKAGRHTVLATGSQRHFADRIAAHLNLFDVVVATEHGINLTSHNKAARLNELYGKNNYDYIGNSRADIPVWHSSHTVWSVTSKAFVLPDGRRTSQIGTRRPAALPYLLKAMRPRQWLKNLLVFVPMMTGHAFTAEYLLQSLLAFAAFSLCASSAYLLNDALDVHDDRIHPIKCRRPIASGHLPIPVAMIISPLLAASAALLCLNRPILMLALLIYLLATISYSLFLKRLAMIDIVTLALLYTMRILGGAAATGITASFWLLGFSFFIFLSLALLKRYSELINLHLRGKEKTSGRGYSIHDRIPIGVMGVCCAFMSVMMFMLYFNSQTVLLLYHRPFILLGIVPMLVYWLGRLWLLCFRGEVNEDPVLYVSKDPVSLGVIAICAALALCAAG